MSIEAVDVIAEQGMVTSTNPLASPAGREMLLSGGNAVDAAVATALALCVVQPSSNGIAGYGGCMVIYLANERRVVAIDYNCRAPRAVTPDMYELAEESEPVSWNQFPPVVDRKNTFGPLAVSVPGTIAGLSLAEKKYGRLGWRRVLEPAMKLAADGFEVYDTLPENIQRFADNTDPESAQAFFPDGRTPEAGETWVQPDLAKLLEVLADDPDALYHGKPARRIAKRVRSMGGIITEKDMADMRAEVSEPLTLEYKGVRLNASPGVTGSPTALQALAILAKLHPERYDPNDPEHWGDLAGALTLAWRDRLTVLGDVPGIQEKIRGLLSEEYAASLAELVRTGKIGSAPGDVDIAKETIHCSACDADRNMVALTQTHGGGWGSRVAVPGLGIVLGHGMSRFDPRPGLPNSPGPWKSPLHNMSPLILTVDGKLVGCVGLPGGRTIPSLIPQFVIGLVDFGMTPGEMLSRPRIHTEGAEIRVTEDVPEMARNAIEVRGHELKDVNALGGMASGILVKRGRIIASAQAGPEASLGI